MDCLGKRWALYPLGCVLVFGWFGLVHQAQAAVVYRCVGCGAEFGRRSALARIMLVLWVLVSVMYAVAILLLVAAAVLLFFL